VRTPKFRHETEWPFYQGKFVGADNDGNTNAYGVLPVITRYAELYQQDVADHVIVLWKKDTNIIKKKPYYTRFSPGYYAEKARQIQQLNKIERFHRGLFLTLTVDPKRYCCAADAIEALHSQWNRMHTWMMRPKKDASRYPVKEWGGEYLKVVEFQENSTKLPHMHVCLFGAKYADIGMIREEWERWMGEGTFFHVRRLKPHWKQSESGEWYRTTAINYVLKYMWKAANNSEHLVELWALCARAYTTSRGLLGPIFNSLMNNSNAEKPQWVYLGAFPSLQANTWSTYIDIIRDLGG